MPPAHEEEALPQVRDAIVKEVDEPVDRGVPSLLKEYSASVLHPMKRDLQRAVQQATKDAFRVKRVVCQLCRFENESQILSPQQQDHILSWLPESSGGDQLKLQLLYQASRDGWQCEDFLSRCDNTGATVTVIKCKGGFVFGGYVDFSWSSLNSYGVPTEWSQSAQAFLFSLHSPSGVGAVKLPLLGGGSHQAIRCHPNQGPTFGGGLYICLFDLHVADCANSNTYSCTNLDNTYQLPSGRSAHIFFTRGQYFQAAEVEV